MGDGRLSGRNKLFQALACSISKLSFTLAFRLEFFRCVDADKTNRSAVVHADRVPVRHGERLSMKAGGGRRNCRKPCRNSVEELVHEEAEDQGGGEGEIAHKSSRPPPCFAFQEQPLSRPPSTLQLRVRFRNGSPQRDHVVVTDDLSQLLQLLLAQPRSVSIPLQPAPDVLQEGSLPRGEPLFDQRGINPIYQNLMIHELTCASFRATYNQTDSLFQER